MISRTIGGWALVANAALMLALFIAMSADSGDQRLLLAAAEVLGPLFVVGLLAIWSMLPHGGSLGRLGLIGLLCLGIAAGIAFLVRLVLLFSTADIGELVPLSSAAFALVGSLLVGWVTTRTPVFPSAIGWLLMAGGVLNIVGGLLPASAGAGAATVMAVATTVAQVGALGGYGWTLLRHATLAQRASVAQG